MTDVIGPVEVSRPRLVFIHGTSGPKPVRKWLKPLKRTLEDLGEHLDEVEVVKIQYMSLLKKPTPGPALEERRRVVITPAREEEFRRHRRSLAARLEQHARRKKPWGRKVPKGISKLGALAVRATVFNKTARRYLDLRGDVTAHIRDALGPGEFIIIGYSLGSVVAADLLSVLRTDQHVRLLVTVGSPLGQKGLWKRTARACRPFPKDRVDAWVNIHNTSDPVTGWVGLSRRFPDVIDVPIGGIVKPPLDRERHDPRKVAMAQHKIRGYTRHPVLAEAVAWALGADEPRAGRRRG